MNNHHPSPWRQQFNLLHFPEKVIQPVLKDASINQKELRDSFRHLPERQMALIKWLKGQ